MRYPGHKWAIGMLAAVWGLAAILLAVVLARRGDETNRAAESDDGPSASSGTKTVEPGEIEEIGSHLLSRAERNIRPAPAPHVEIPVPSGWTLGPRNDKAYLLRLEKSQRSKYPLMTIRREEGDFESAELSTFVGAGESDIRKYVQEYQQRLQSTLKEGTISTPARAVKIGERYVVYYVQRVTGEGDQLDKLVAHVLLDKERFEVELLTPRGLSTRLRFEPLTVAGKLELTEPEQGADGLAPPAGKPAPKAKT